MLSSLSIVIPAYNEEPNLRIAVEDIVSVLPKVAAAYEIIIVNDGSQDTTGLIAEELARQYSFIRVIHHFQNIGFGGGIRTGLKEARSEYVMFIPADRQFSPQDILNYLPYTNEADIVLGIRLRRKDPLLRKINTIALRVAMFLLFRITLRDINWVKLFRRSFICDIPLSSKGIGIDAELIVKAKRRGARFREVPVGYFARMAGQATSCRPKAIVDALIELVKLRLGVLG
ncbi:MAG: glycosyltransferase family 2 protein [Ignavibacteriales bacterium]